MSTIMLYQREMVDDLAKLSELTDNLLLDEIEARYKRNIIYTYIGDILLAVNPYKELDIYTPEILKKYTHVTIRSHLPPHIFCISDHAYAKMFCSRLNQCCVICGESGSGKTESTKLMIKHILEICDQKKGDLLQKIIEVNPLLEAFGNAQTIMNNNSSRFGKYFELQFDSNGMIIGANISEYLLEKSRVIQQSPGERNFHIFYSMFAGIEPKMLQINLMNKPANHRILRPADGSEVFAEIGSFSRGAQMWVQTQKIMDIIGFSSEDKESMTAMLTAVIHICDIRFTHDPDTDGSYIENEERLEIVSLLLGTDMDHLSAALTTNETTVSGCSSVEKIVTLKNVYQAADGRDALAKALYGRLFGWIIRQINCTLNTDNSGVSSSTIGILDIYGFENFKTNSFEQLCINIANEQIQNFFTRHIFKMELSEYAKEGINGSTVQFEDNENIINLFFEKNGFYDLINEESKFPGSNDLTLIEKLEKAFDKRPEFQRPKSQNLQFIIKHYAGQVSYCASGFLEKNRDLLSANLLDCMTKSESVFVADLFSATISDSGSLNLKSNNIKLPIAVGNRGLVTKTLSNYFKNSLARLLDKMKNAEPHFIRCLRPNALKMSDSFNREIVLRQLQNTGVLQMVAIRRQGYAIRLPFAEFLKRYKFILYPMVSNVESGPNNCRKVLLKAQINKFEIGKTKVFLKYYHAEQLDNEMLWLVGHVVILQKYFRALLARKLYLKMLKVPWLSTPTPPPRASKISTVELMLEEAMHSMLKNDASYWGKLHVVSNDIVLLKFLLRESQIVLDNSEANYNGSRIGLGAYEAESFSREQLREIGNGVEIENDGHGNLFLRGIGNCEVIVKGYREESNCLSEEIIQVAGRLSSRRMKVFDIQKFKGHIASELRNAIINIRRIEMLSMVSFGFCLRTVPLDNYVIIVNFAALDLLGDLRVLSELKQMAALKLTREDDEHLQRTWSAMQRRTPT